MSKVKNIVVELRYCSAVESMLHSRRQPEFEPAHDGWLKTTRNCAPGVDSTSHTDMNMSTRGNTAIHIIKLNVYPKYCNLAD